ncbi:MAG: MBL fold metallo-hydrolase RNA specificity domain-containing protein [Syntrophomonadaceae bacterium]|jgi:metallo-beta-lactamase family protein
MKLKFLGATKTVTGACFLVETAEKRFLIDCGLFQGSKDIKEKNYKDFTINPRDIDFLVLTHAHIDHIGLVPKFCKAGFSGPIYCSHATEELASILLPDSGYIQETEVERKNRKLKRAGKLLIEPIYTVQDALDCLPQFKSLNMDERITLAPGIDIRLRDAGHILGSCIVELWIQENNKQNKLVFTGDLGNSNQPIIKDPTVIENADFVIMESTYGNRYHKSISRRVEQLKEAIQQTMARGGNLIIPAFAVERTQDILYDLSCLFNSQQIDSNIDVYIDSPLAIAATKIFHNHIDLYDHETRQLIDNNEHPLLFNNLKFSQTQEESIRLNSVKSNTIIISASGMCDAGRIKYHLKNNLWRPECTVLFVGYQAMGTLGRRIVDGEKLVTIHGEQIAVKAEIKSIEAYSAHADRAGLITWLRHFSSLPKAVFLVHGEEEAQNSLRDLIINEISAPVYIPNWLDEYDLEELEQICLIEKNELVHELNLSKALKAEKMYLNLRLKLHNLFEEKWQQENYDEIIEYIRLINSKIG